jgi:hypothetical protein
MDSGELVFRTRSIEPVVVLQAEGVLGLVDVGRAITALAWALRTHGHGVVVCDVSRLEVTGRSLLSVFPAALRRAGRWPARSLHLAEPGPALERGLLSLRVARYLPVHPTMDAALAAARRDAVLERHEIPLDPVLGSVHDAREALQGFYLATCGDSVDREDALLIVSELTTNALQHVTEPFSLAMTRSRQRLVVAVHDPSRQEPILRPPRQTAGYGRGMQLIDRLSLAWGVRLVHADGKTVWAALPAPSSSVPASRRPVAATPAAGGRAG